MKRPTTNGDQGSYCTTPNAASLLMLVGGGLRREGVAVSSDEKRALERLYGFVPEKPNTKPEAPPAPRREEFPKEWPGGRDYAYAMKAHEAIVKALAKWQDPLPMLQGGADINLMRHAEVDGLRLIAWLAKHINSSEDPLKVLIELAANAGWDVDPQDVDWAQGSEESEEE